jgi:nicotinamide riboside kinase
VIALLGAESTGKSDLAAALADALAQRGLRATAVPEYLREFCERAGRTPRIDEQVPIADEQWRRIVAAAADGSVVLADTTPLMTAVYSDYVFGDRSLYAAALERQRRCHATLVTGLDLPWLPDGLQRDGAHAREPVDALLRGALHGAGLAYGVVYGEGEARVTAALAAVAAPLGLAPAAADDGGRPLRLRCRDCLVPGCEHLLFPRLRITP